MPNIAVIGSQDVDLYEWLDDARPLVVPTRDKEVRGTVGKLHGVEIAFIPRNGDGVPRPPHVIDYRSNIEALVSLGCRQVLTTSMAGTVRTAIPLRSLLLLDQFIDFTRNRQFSYFRDGDPFGFADMTEPFCPSLRESTLAAAEKAGVDISPYGCYVCVPGPRFETRAEVRMYGQLGADLIGHTTVTDAVMAREAGLCFVTVAGVITMGAGLGEHAMNAHEWHESRRSCAQRFRLIVDQLAHAASIGEVDSNGCGCRSAAPIER